MPFLKDAFGKSGSFNKTYHVLARVLSVGPKVRHDLLSDLVELPEMLVRVDTVPDEILLAASSSSASETEASSTDTSFGSSPGTSE